MALTAQPMSTQPKSQPLLTLDKSLSAKELVDTRDNFSAIVVAGAHLWLGGDEGTRIDRMIQDGAGNFGSHRRFDLSTILSLPSVDTEIDIEGLDFNGGYLWLIGWMCRKRRRAPNLIR